MKLPYDYLQLNPNNFLATPDRRWESRVTFSPREVHEMFGVPLSTVYSLCADGKLKAFKVGKHWVIHRKGLFEFIQTQIDSSIIL